jgi:hypothetical protein
VDESGKPVEGATITPNFLRIEETAAEWWSNEKYGPPPTAKTDAEGSALVSYPIELFKGYKTQWIGFVVDHPRFCLLYAGCHAKQDEAPATAKRDEPPVAPGVEPPIVLKRGARLEVSASMAGTAKPAAGMIAYVSSNRESNPPRDCWTEAKPGVLRTDRFPPGPLWLRVMLLPPNAPASFSDPVRLDLKAGESKQIRLELKPGVRLKGRLDSAIPRPIHNGWASLKIIARTTYAERQRARLEEQQGSPANTADQVFPPSGDLDADRLRDPWDWSASTRIRKDGSFVFPSLPPGEAGIVAGCDGFVSIDPADAERKTPQEPQDFAQRNGLIPARPPGSGTESPALDGSGPRNGQHVTLDGSVVKFALPAEKTGTAEFKIIDTTGKPVAGASVRFVPNWYWQYKVGWLGSEEYGSAEFLRTGKRPHGVFPSYATKTDVNGVARVSNLPGGPQLYSITHPDFSPPADADLFFPESAYCTLLIVPGKVSKRTEQLQVK